MLSAKYTTEKVKAAVIVRVSKETKEYNFIPVPTMSKVYTHGGAVPLESVLFRYGRDYFVQKVTSMTGIVPDYTFVVNITEMDDVMSAVGSFNCYIHEEIFSDGKNYFLEPEVTTAPETTSDSDSKDKKKDKTEATTEIVTEEVTIEKVVDAGNITVGPKNIEAILLFEDYSGGQTNRSTLIVDILKGIISRLAEMDEETLGKLYDELIGESEIAAETTASEEDDTGDDKKDDKEDKEEDIIVRTDMTKEDLLRKAELLSVFGEYESTFYEYPGTQKGNEFIPDIDKATLELIPLRILPDPTKGQE